MLSKYINSRHSNIRFKSERGKEPSISFIDVLITKNNGLRLQFIEHACFNSIIIANLVYARVNSKITSSLLFLKS